LRTGSRRGTIITCRRAQAKEALADWLLGFGRQSLEEKRTMRSPAWWVRTTLPLLATILLLVPDGLQGGQAGSGGGEQARKAETSCTRKAVPLPTGWRRAAASEASSDWRGRDRCRHLVVSADFNGDGLSDQAELLVSESAPEFGPFAFVAQRDGTYREYRLGDAMPLDYFEVMGIRPVRPGLYRTACGKGYAACEVGEPKVLRLRTWSIDFFKEESANSFFYWNGRAASFKRVWISD
jgi:hypothetical protein